MRKHARLLAHPIAALLLVAGCLKPERTAGGSVEENEILAGIILAENGDPVPGAQVRLYPVDHIPGESGSAAYSVETDAGGRYVVDSLPRGEYNILGAKDGRVSYRDSVFLGSGRVAEVRDTLRDPGSLAGIVRLQQGDDPRSVTVHVVGTQVFVNVDEEGRFSLSGLAEGEYRLRAETLLDDYVPLFETIRVRSGRSDILGDTLEIPYIGIPLVPGIEAELDTLAGVAKITWEDVRYRNFKNYVVVRSIRGSLDPSGRIVGMPTENSFQDTLYPGGSEDYGLAAGTFPGPVSLEYHVRIRELGGDFGRMRESAVLDAVAPSWVRTHLELKVLGADDGMAGRGDTVAFVAAFRNRSRTLDWVRWTDREGRILRESPVSGRSHAAADTLRRARSDLGELWARAEVEDASGATASMALRVAVVASPPRVSAGRDTAVPGGKPVRLRGTAETRFGRIARTEWDVGMTGNFQASSDGTVEVPGPDGAGEVACVFRAANEDGDEASDTVRVIFKRKLERVGAAPSGGNEGALVEFRGRLWMIGGDELPGQEGTVFSSADGMAWRQEADSAVVTRRRNAAVFVFQDRLWVVGGEASHDYLRTYDDIWWTADGARWNLAGTHPHGGLGHPKVAVAGDSLYLWVDGYSHYYVSGNGSEWRRVAHVFPDAAAIGRADLLVTLDGTLVLGMTNRFDYDVAPTIYHSRDGGFNWRTFGWALQMGSEARATLSTTVHEGRIWAVGGREVVYVSTDGVEWIEDHSIAWDARNPGVLFQRGTALAGFGKSLWMVNRGEVYRYR